VISSCYCDWYICCLSWSFLNELFQLLWIWKWHFWPFGHLGDKYVITINSIHGAFVMSIDNLPHRLHVLSLTVIWDCCRVIRFSPFANRLAYDGIPKRIQKLRCYTNFEALRFAPPIAEMSKILVNRMKGKSASSNGNYVSIHLRFEEVCILTCPGYTQ